VYDRHGKPLEVIDPVNPSWYETKLKDRHHKGYKGSKVSHRALQI
jgi:hypothetical protein